MSSSLFECEFKYEPEAGIRQVSVWRSKRTGLRVVVGDIEGPLVNGYFALATETRKDDGCPHTLEHLVFLGSEEYPYKGVLDLIANRCLAEGTNAWTDTDHTAYTITCAGWKGFRNCLNVYLDHILYPTLTESGFITEVHHITGEGHDAGVVYCEMQARENTSSSRCMLQLLRSCFPGTGFASETGGLMKDLRELNIDTIREYHRSYYRPDNLCLIVTGDVNTDDLFELLSDFEEKILSKPPPESMPRPWTTPVKPLTESVTEIVEFPTDDEDIGSVYMAWHGPVWKDVVSKLALDILWRYLTETAVAPLQKELVEREDPLCGSIEHLTTQFSITLSYVQFDDAPTRTLDQINAIALSTIRSAVNEIDMDRLQRIIVKHQREHLSNLEEHPHSAVAGSAIEAFLYADSFTAIETELDMESHIELLLAQSQSFWKDLASTYILDRPCVCVIGQPSAALSKQQADDEVSRIAKTVETLGPEKLHQLAKDLVEAEALNNVETPPRVLESFEIPNVAEVSSFLILSSASAASDQSTTADVDKLVLSNIRKVEAAQIPVDVAHVRSRFVQLRALLNTEALTDRQRSLLPLYTEMLFESCVTMDDGRIASHEEVINALDEASVAYFGHVGLSRGSSFGCSEFSSLLMVSLRFPDSGLDDAVNWMRRVLVLVEFTPDRIKVCAQRLLMSIASMKREGRSIARAALMRTHFHRSCNHVCIDMFSQEKLLHRVLELIEEKPDEVVKEYVELKQNLASTAWFFAVLNTSTPYSGTLVKVLQEGLPASNGGGVTVPFSRQYLRPCGFTAVIVEVAGLESAYLYRARSCVPEDCLHEDLPPLLLAIEVLCALEGPFWKRIRGLGLSYGYAIDANPESSLLTFSLSESTDVVSSFNEAKSVLQGMLGSAEEISPLALAAARSSVSFELLSKSSTLSRAAFQVLKSKLKKVPHNYNQVMIEKIMEVSSDRVTGALREYIAPLFGIGDAEKKQQREGSLVISCGPGMADAIVDGFKRHFDWKLEKHTVESFFGDSASV